MSAATTVKSVGLLGCGEAAFAFVSGLKSEGNELKYYGYDIKFHSQNPDISAAKHQECADQGVGACESVGELAQKADLIFSLVTADQANDAANAIAAFSMDGILFFDGNSCSPGAKKRSAEAVENSGGRYVDCAIMSPVHPKLHKTPCLLAGPHAQDASDQLAQFGMMASPVEGEVGAASSIKMIRSIMVKGLEALVMECVLAGKKAGVDDTVLQSLEASYPGFDWTGRAAYMMERVMTHGRRRAAEMREVAATVEELGLKSEMARATVEWQSLVGELGLDARQLGEGHAERADAILNKLAQVSST